MKKIRLLFLLVLVLIAGHSTVFSQNIQQLKSQLETAQGGQKAQIQLQIAFAYLDSDPNMSLEYANAAVGTCKEVNSANCEANANMMLARAFMKLKNLDQALRKAQMAADHFKTQDKKFYLQAQSIVSDIYFEQSKYADLIKVAPEVYDGFVASGDKLNAAFLASTIGSAYEKLQRYKDAAGWHNKAYDNFAAVGRNQEAVRSLSNVAGVYNNYGNYSASEKALEKAIAEAKKHGMNQIVPGLEQRLSIVRENLQEASKETVFGKEKKEEQEQYVRQVEFQKAKSLEEIEKLSAEKQLVELKIRAQQDEYEKQLLKEQFEKIEAKQALMEKEAENQKISLALENEKLLTEKQAAEKQRLFIMLGGVVLVVLIVLYAFISKRRDNIKLAEQNNKIIKQKEEIERKNQDIAESIDYAMRIQMTLLPSHTKFTELFPKSFIFYNPKDKVSGDFFWFAHIGHEVFVCTADCTGHGVPGAFMSIVFNTILDELVRKQNVHNPAEILEASAVTLTKRIEEKGEDLSLFKDGMDASIIRLNLNTGDLSFSGARNSIYIVRNGELSELKATRRSVNVITPNTVNKKEFELNQERLNKGDRVFMFSDGFADQKGGDKGEKFYYKPFRDLLLETSSLPVKEQKDKLSTTFFDWKKDREQIDDVTVVGVEF
jgi:serine phosphatase RsbU (regulator of sigma subunit)